MILWKFKTFMESENIFRSHFGKVKTFFFDIVDVFFKNKVIKENKGIFVKLSHISECDIFLES